MNDDRIKILVIEDEETHAELIRRSFVKTADRFELLVGSNLAAARLILNEFQPDIIISDLLLPDGKGTDLIDDELRRICPFIVMTSFGDEHAAVEAIKAGALDYVVKSVNSMTEMPRIVERALREWSHIAERARAEEALAKSEERYRATFENCGNALMVVENDTTISMCNREFEILSGYSKAEVEGQLSWKDIVADPNDLARMLEYHRLRRLGPELAPRSYEFQLIDRLGATKDVMITVSLLPNCLTSLAAMADITEHKQSEAARHSLENQLTQARKLEAIGRLAGGISHDFNNLLTVICGYAELLLAKDDVTPATLREGLEEILGAGKRARDLTRQLLAFGRKQVLKLRAVSLNEVIIGFEKMLKRLIGEDIIVSISLEPNLPLILADVTQIEQIILNLALNARDAMPGGGRLEISTRLVPEDDVNRIQELAAGQYIVLTVSDNGCGMDTATIEQIFEPFFTTKELGKGTGLGLSTVYGIVKQHDGSVRCDSQPGSGTTFQVYLPRTELTPGAAPKVASTMGGEATMGQETILLVEDDLSMRQMVCRMLNNTGYRVLAATDSQDALRLARETKPIDLLLSDVVMPSLNGPQVRAEVAIIHPSVKTLFMSGYSEDVIQDRGLMEGQINLLRKPFSTQDLLQAIKQTLLQK